MASFTAQTPRSLAATWAAGGAQPQLHWRKFATGVALLEATLLAAGNLAALAPPGAASAAAGCSVGLAWLISAWLCDGYEMPALRRLGVVVRRTPPAFAATVCTFALVSAILPLPARPALGVGAFTLLALTVIAAVRLSVVHTLRRPGYAERVLVLGSGPLSHRICEALRANPRCGQIVAGVGDGALADRLIERIAPERIIVASLGRRGCLSTAKLLALRLAGVAIEDGADAYERLTGKLAIEAIPPSHLLFADGFRASKAHAVAARGLSIAVALASLLVLAPLFAIIALAVKLDDGGPLLFLQQRVGLGGEPFLLFKFRSMRAANGPHSEWVGDNQGRITRVGRLLRRFRLDELPQLVNVLRGELNLVGPRPHPVSNFDLFLERIPYYGLRCVVRPGVTGWAQIRQGYAGNLAEETEKMRYDLYYIKHASLLLDLRILAATLPVLLAGRERPPHRSDSDAAWRDVRVDTAAAGAWVSNRSSKP